jgi:hypothetical protein
MTRPKRMEINCETGVTSIIELTDEEIAQMEVMAAEEAVAQAVRDAEAAATQAAKESAQAKLAALGLTADEITAITK